MRFPDRVFLIKKMFRTQLIVFRGKTKVKLKSEMGRRAFYFGFKAKFSPLS